MRSFNIINSEARIFANRQQAGDILAHHLQHLQNCQDLLILGIPRGGVVVAHQIAQSIGGILDVVLTRKLPAPHNPELAIGAVSENGDMYLNDELIASLAVSSQYIDHLKQEQLAEIKARQKLYRRVLPKASLKDKTVVITDDGVATGATTLASIWATKAEKPAKIILAVPAGPPESLRMLSNEVDELISFSAPSTFYALGQFYMNFEPVSDEQVLEILSRYKTDHTD